MRTSSSDRRREFAALHRPGEPLYLPNVWDHASAATLAAAGYRVLGTTSLGVAAAAGKPDAEGATRADTVVLTQRLAALDVLLTVDVEGGFADEPEAVAELVEQVAAAGAVGVNLEDGCADGTLTATARHAAKIAAVKARVPDLFVNARTDAFWLRPDGIEPTEEALARGQAYIDAGADGFFVPAAADLATITTLAERVAAPLNVLYLPGRHTLADLAGAGVARVSLGSLLFRAALHATRQLTDEIAGRHHDTPPPIPSYADVTALLSQSPQP